MVIMYVGVLHVCEHVQMYMWGVPCTYVCTCTCIYMGVAVSVQV